MKCSLFGQQANTLWAPNNPSAPPDKIPLPTGNNDQSLLLTGDCCCVCVCTCECVLSSRGNSLLSGIYGMQPRLAFITLGSPFNSFGRKWNTRMALLQSAWAICSQGRDIPEHVFHIKRVSGSHRCMLTGCVWYACVCVCVCLIECIWERRGSASRWVDKEREGKKVFWCLLRPYSHPWAVNSELLHSRAKASCLHWPVNAWKHTGQL